MTSHNYPFGYCTNVHAGISLEAAQANLQKISCDVRQRVTQAGLPVGLWLPETALVDLQNRDSIERFREWLGDHQLIPYTFNGFPQRDFHQPVVKHAVYEPDWRTVERLNYTTQLAHVLAGLIPESSCGSISTLPLGWPHQPWTHDDYQLAASRLQTLAQTLSKIRDASGREIVLAMEPEPGCVIDTAPDLAHFFERYLFQGTHAETCRTYLTVCHDICHSAVMFEPQSEAIQTYARSGIRLGKVQVSAAVAARWSSNDAHAARDADNDPVLAQLKKFNEPRYLHQTTRRSLGTTANSATPTRTSIPTRVDMVEDLPEALHSWLPNRDRDEWRVHFHVPIFVQRFGALESTQGDIKEVLTAIAEQQALRINDRPWFTGHFEVETYAWNVLPSELATSNLAEGIAKELTTFADLWSAVGLTQPN